MNAITSYEWAQQRFTATQELLAALLDRSTPPCEVPCGNTFFAGKCKDICHGLLEQELVFISYTAYLGHSHVLTDRLYCGMPADPNHRHHRLTAYPEIRKAKT